MMRARIAGVVLVVLVLFALTVAAGREVRKRRAVSDEGASHAATPAIEGAHAGQLYGRVTTEDGAVYEGRLRWGGDEETLWGHTFNGYKDENPWAAYAPTERRSIGAFGIEIPLGERKQDVGRPFMARFGDIARIEPRGRDIRVTLKSGAVIVLDRFAADDLADGLRVWDAARGVVDIGEQRIRTIEFLPAANVGAGPYPLHGTVRTRHGSFTGLIEWGLEASVGSDTLDGRTASGHLSLRFDTIRSIARRSPDSSAVTLQGGQEVVLSGSREVGDGDLGIYVDDPRYGRVLIFWDTFERVDFSDGGTGPAYGDFPPGRPLTGSVTTRSGRRLTGRLVFDLDESETTETLDAPSQGVDYTIPFGRVTSIVPVSPDARGVARATVTLNSGEALQLEPAGDLGEGNAGLLIFSDGRPNPEYVPWSDVEQVDLDHPPELDPPTGQADDTATSARIVSVGGETNVGQSDSGRSSRPNTPDTARSVPAVTPTTSAPTLTPDTLPTARLIVPSRNLGGAPRAVLVTPSSDPDVPYPPPTP